MCVVPIVVTGFDACPFNETDVITSGFTLCCGWRRQLTNKDAANNQLHMISHDRQVWTFCCSSNVLWGSPGWCAIHILPFCPAAGSARCARRIDEGGLGRAHPGPIRVAGCARATTRSTANAFLFPLKFY